MLAVIAAACGGGGGDADDAAPRGDETAAVTVATVAPEGAPPEVAPVLPVTVTGADGEETTVADVSRIIPANGDIAEVVFALGLGDRVVGTDVSATYPPEADALPEVGYQRTLLAEPMLGLEPTVVVGNTGAGPPGVIEQLRNAGVPVVIVDHPHDLTGPPAKIRLVARALGVPARGEALARQVEAAIDDAAAGADRHKGEPPRAALLYLRGGAVRQVGGAGTGVEFQPLGDEALIRAAPDVLVVTTSGLASVGGVDGLVEIPAVAGTPAGRDRRVIALDDQLLLGLGPRTGDALRRLVDDLHPSTTSGETT